MLLTDATKIKKPCRVKCLIWKGNDVSPVLKADTGDIAILKLIKRIEAIEAKRAQA